jgi:O-antigen/teichoic acid export membrane protein
MVSTAVPAGRARPRLAALVARYRYAVPALDQVALSLFNFALNLVLVRLLTATDFGIVSLWIAVSLLAVGVQNALVNGPLSVYLPAARDEAAARRLEAALATVNLVATVAIAAAAGIVNLAADAEWAPHEPLVAIAIPLFIGIGLYREYCRSTAFSRHDMAMLLWIDLPYLAATALCLGAMLLWPHRLAGLFTAFLAMSVGGAASQLCLRRRGGFRLAPPFRRGSVAAYRPIAGEVGWSLAGVFANHVETRSYTYIATSLAGLAALAAINVVGVLFRPMMVLMGAWSRPALSQFVRLLARGDIAAFDRMLYRALAVAVAGSAAWFFVLSAAWRPVEHYLLAGKYPEAEALLLPWAVASGASLLRFIAGTALTAAREFKYMAYAQLVCGAVAAAATVAMIVWQGYAGAMWGIAIGNALCLGWHMARLRRVRRPGFLGALPPWEG